MHALGHTFDTEITAIRVAAYFDALCEHPLELVQAATREAIKTCRFFPKPVELLEILNGRQEDACVDAWAAVLSEVRRVGYIGKPRFSEPAIMQTIRALTGSWERFCSLLPEGGPEHLGWRKRFGEAYRIYSIRERQLALADGDARRTLRDAAAELSHQPSK